MMIRLLKFGVLLVGILPNLVTAAAPEIITVDTVQMQGKAVLGGTVIPYKEVTMTAQIPGAVEYLAGAEGDFFEAGQVLVAIDDSELLAKRNAVLAQMANADAVLRNSYVQYGREVYMPQSRSTAQGSAIGMGMPSLFDQMFSQGMSDFMGYREPGLERYSDLHRSRTGVNQAYSSVIQARSQLDEIDAALRDTRSVAPFDGVILGKMVEVGDTVQPGMPLLYFGHVKYLRIQADVPARLVQFLQIGQFVPAYLDTAKTRVDARVSQVYPLADRTQHTVTVKFDLPSSVPGGPGMYAEVMVPDGQTPKEPTVIIPSSALVRAGSLPGVLVVREANTSELRLVRLGPKVGASNVTILAGLRPGERIIDNPPPGASSGWMPSTPKSPRNQ